MSAAVLITTDAVGGVWRYTIDLARGLRAAGCRVVLAGLGPAPSDAQRAEAAGIGPLEWGEPPLDWLAPGPEALAGVVPWLARLTACYRPTHLHLNLPTQAAGLPALSGDPEVVVASHSCLATWFAAVQGREVPADMAWNRDLTARGFDRADTIVAPSRSHAEAITRAYGLTKPVRVVHNAALPAGEVSGRAPEVVSAGRWWDAGKNAACLDAAAARLPWPVRMIGATEGPNGTAARLDHAEALGALPAEAARRRIAGAGVFVAPSRYEPFGLAVLEAALGGAPLVLADIPTFRELWDGAALFFDPNDPGALAETAERPIRDRYLARRLGAAAVRRARRYTPEAQVQGMLDIYQGERGTRATLTAAE
jgi:glycosyltransferase involved in cell wall biosynthesis